MAKLWRKLKWLVFFWDTVYYYYYYYYYAADIHEILRRPGDQKE